MTKFVKQSVLRKLGFLVGWVSEGGRGGGRGVGKCRKGQQKKDVERVWICSGTTEFLGH